MKHPLIAIFTLLLLLTACARQAPVSVVYEASGAVSTYQLSYLTEDGVMVDSLINADSYEDVWRYSMKLDRGDIVFLSGKYQDINSSLKLSVKVNGKIYKEQYSVGDTVHYLIVSGTVPY